MPQALNRAGTLIHNRPTAKRLTASSVREALNGEGLEAILKPSKFGKNCGERVADHVEPLLDLRAVGPQERVLRQLRFECDG